MPIDREKLAEDIARKIAAERVNRRERCVEPADRSAWCADYAMDHWPEYLPEARAALAVAEAAIRADEREQQARQFGLARPPRR